MQADLCTDLWTDLSLTYIQDVDVKTQLDFFCLFRRKVFFSSDLSEEPKCSEFDECVDHMSD